MYVLRRTGLNYGGNKRTTLLLPRSRCRAGLRPRLRPADFRWTPETNLNHPDRHLTHRGARRAPSGTALSSRTGEVEELLPEDGPGAYVCLGTSAIACKISNVKCKFGRYRSHTRAGQLVGRTDLLVFYMPKYPAERAGVPLKVLQRNLEFSYWPMARETRRFGLQSRVFASDPWNVFERAVHLKCPKPVEKLALAYLEQARDFFLASQAGNVRAAKPLLVYYCFMNLVKTFGLTKQVVATMGDHHHGMTPNFGTGPGPGGGGSYGFPEWKQNKFV
jgi:hypothetical protein